MAIVRVACYNEKKSGIGFTFSSEIDSKFHNKLQRNSHTELNMKFWSRKNENVQFSIPLNTNALCNKSLILNEVILLL